MKYFLSALISLLFLKTIQSQVITANISIDKFGNLFVSELIDDLDISLDTILINKNILIHNKYADLIGDENHQISYKPKNKAFSFVVNFPKNNNNYIKKEDFFFTGINYLATKKQKTPGRNTFDIHINLPINYKLVYPEKDDLKTPFYHVPSIIAGKFKEQKIQNYTVFTLESEKYYTIQLNTIIGYMDKVFQFYSEKFGAVKQPKIIFLPFKGSLKARTIDNAIILNSNRFKHKPLGKKILAHEIAHLWWGFGNLFFKNHEITEGMADFMALQFLKQKDEHAYLKNKLESKNYNSEGISNLNKVEDKQKDKRLFSYNFVPLMFQTYQNNNASFYELLPEFYNANKSKITVSLNDLNQFLVKKNLPKINTNTDLPDFFILEDTNFLVIKGATKKPTDVVIEYLNADNTINYDTLTFSSTSKAFRIQKATIIKASIDPDNKIHQFSKLNDIWHKDQSSLFSKNSYFNIGKIHPKVIKMSENMLDYLFDKSNTLSSICESQFKLKSELVQIKNILKDEGLNTIIPTGAVTTHNRKKHIIYLKFTYYSRVENKSKLMVLHLFTDKDLKYLDKVKQNFPLKK